MIEKYQELLIRFTDRTLHEFWDMTEAETAFYIRVGKQKLQDEIDFQVRLHADTVVSIMNAPMGPYLKKGQKYPYKLNEYLSNEPKKKNDVSAHDWARQLVAAGDAMMDVVEQHEKSIRKCRR